ERQLCKPALVVYRNGRLVLNGPLDVVHADVVAEHRPGVLVGQLDGSAGESDESRVREGVMHMPGEAVNEVVLTPVRLVGDHHDVASLREDRVLVSLFLWEELLDRREHHTASLHT